MRNMKFIFLILLLFGCEKIYCYEFVIKNDTNYNITIKGFDRIDLYNDTIPNYKSNPDVISIQPNSSYSVIKQRGFHADDFGIFKSVEIDSVNIIFNNERILIQFCDLRLLRACEFDRNIAGYETEYVRVKTGRSSMEKEYRYTYTITEDDYNKAVPIE